MRIGLIAPPWITVPPTGYGGTEAVIDNLARGLDARGHEVRLFTVADSTCQLKTSWFFEHPQTPIGVILPEATHVLAAYDEFHDVDVIHDHTTLGPLLSLGRAAEGIPVVMTNHGPITPLSGPVLMDAARRTALVAISHSQRQSAPELPTAAVIHNGIDVAHFRFGPGGGGYVLFIGRMIPDKGPHRAVEIARAAGRRLVLMTKMWEEPEQEFFEAAVRPLLGPDVEVVTDLGPNDRVELVRHAEALINPIRWREPFGLVMAEALACGTPVLAFPEGAAPEIVDDGRTGFLVNTEAEMAAALDRVGEIDRQECRRSAEEEFSLEHSAAQHEVLYQRLIDGDRPSV